MNEGSKQRTCLRGFAFIVTLCLFSLNASAQEKEFAVTSGAFRIQPALFFGAGASKVDVGTTTDGDTVSISGGGGLGGGVTVGYGLSSHLDLDFSLGYEESVLTPAVSNADGTFDRTFYLVTLKYRIPVSKRFHIKLGGGGGVYKPGELDVDTRSVFGGAHDIIKYKTATGAHVLTEFEFFVSGSAAVNIGMKYYSVTYHESSGTRNGMPGYFFGNEIENLDGSGFDLMLSFAKYF